MSDPCGDFSRVYRMTTAERIDEIDSSLATEKPVGVQPSQRIRWRQDLLEKRAKLVKKLINEVKKNV